MRTVRLVIATVAAAALVPLTASAAFADPPANDKPAGAIPVSLGDTVKQNTSQATTGRKDAMLNAVCGAPFTNASVWYTYAPTEDGSFILDMSQSDYTGGFMVFEGAPTAKSMVACGPTTVGVDGTAGTTYTIMVFSDTKTNGGNLVMSLKSGPPPPTMAVSVDAKGQVFKNGKAQLSGSFVCKNADFVENDGTLTQIWRRVKITGDFRFIARRSMCDGVVHPWTKLINSPNGLFAEGTAKVAVRSFGCGLIDCANQSTRRTVTLTKATGTPAATAAAPAAPLAACGSLWAAGSIREHPCLPSGR